MKPKRLEWKLKRRSIQLGDRTLVMAILNVTPDSFSDGGLYTDPDRAFARAVELEEQGADILDIGAESTRPGAKPVSEAEELRRLIPVLKRLRDQLSIPISVDTYKAAVAEKALELGVEIINDPSGLTFDPQLARVVVNHDAGLVINHMRGTPETWAKLGPLPDVAGSVARELEASAGRARQTGLDRERIVVDPGLGFGKRKEQNAELLARLPQIARLGFPILVGPSRKSFLARPSDEETRFASAAAVAAAVLGGAHIVRVHDIREMLAVVQVADSVVAAQPDADQEDAAAAKPRGGTARRSWMPPAAPQESGPPRPPRPFPPRAREDVQGPPPSPEDRPVRRDESRPSREDRPAPRGDRPAPRGDRPAPRGDRPAPRGDRPGPRDDRFAPRGDRPGPRGDRPGPRGDRPGPRGDRPGPRDDRFAPRGDRPGPRGDRPGPRGDRPAPRGDRPAPRGDRPAPRGDRPGPRGDRPAPRGDRPGPRDDRFAPRGDRPAPRGDRPAPRGDRPAPRGDRPGPRGDRPAPRGDRPGPRGKRPFGPRRPPERP